MKWKIIFTAILVLSAAFIPAQKLPLVTQSIDLKSGWNIISVYLNPDNLDMKTIFRTLISDGSLVKVQDEAGNSLEDFGVFGGWTNNIGNISPTKGYKVKVSRDCQVNICGIPLSLPLEIPLKAGWNIIGYPRNSIMNGQEIVQQLMNRNTLIKVQDENGNAIENFGIFGGWSNNIGNFKPGEGYKIKVTSEEILTIQEDITGKLISHSNCKNFVSAFQAYTTPDTVSCIDYTYDAYTRKLSVQHRNAAFNCCPEEIFCKVSESNDTIIIQESEKSHLCLCLCLFDLNIEVNGVDTKKYQVKIIEPYARGKDEILFGMDLAIHTERTFCVTRKYYPWGI